MSNVKDEKPEDISVLLGKIQEQADLGHRYSNLNCNCDINFARISGLVEAAMAVVLQTQLADSIAAVTSLPESVAGDLK